MRNERGQVLVIAIVVMLVLAISIPAIIKFMQSESQWTLKEQKSTRAFQLAETAVERGYQQIILSTTAWTQLQAGTPLAGYNFDTVYTDAQNNKYSIRMVGDPVNDYVTITGVGKDSSGAEIRAIKATYAIPGAYPSSIYALQSATIQGNPTVEWGPVVSPGPVTTDVSHLHPRYFSSSSVSPWDTNPAPPNTDTRQWWSYYTLPTPPQIDLASYKTSAGASCTDQPNCVSNNTCAICYYTAAAYPTFNPGTNNFFDGNGASGGGSLIVEGNLSLNGHYGNGTVHNIAIPSTAYKEYCNDWAFYRTNYDPGVPYADCTAAANANYAPTGLTYATISNVFVHGFIYIGGTISISGGGNADIIGSMYCATVANLGSSHVTFWYDANVISNVRVKNNTMMRASWQDVGNCSWTSAATYPTCP